MTSGCKPLSDQELVLLLSFIKKPRDRALVVLGVKSGFRISELLSLKVCDVTQHGVMGSRVAVSKRNTKGKIAGRSVPLHPEAAAALKHIISIDMAPSSYLFQSREGGAISACQAWRIITRAAKQAKLTGKVACHSMRKTFGQKVYDATGKDLVATQRAMGHSNIDSTSKYILVDQTAIDDIIKNI